VRCVVEELAREAERVSVRQEEVVGIPSLWPEVRRHLSGHARTLRRVLPVGARDQNNVNVRIFVLPRRLAVAGLDAVPAKHHDPGREPDDASFSELVAAGRPGGVIISWNAMVLTVNRATPSLLDTEPLPASLLSVCWNRKRMNRRKVVDEGDGGDLLTCQEGEHSARGRSF
jgi:hypothetical protein